MSQTIFKINDISDSRKKKDYEESSFNKKTGLHSKLMVFKDISKIRGIPCSFWKIIMFSLFLLLLATILGAAIWLAFYTRRPALYQEDCKERSCVANQGLKCINNKCDYGQDQYYLKKCLNKKTHGEFCNYALSCLETKGLICYNGKCQCNKNEYWTGVKCTNKKNFGEVCDDNNQCIDSGNYYNVAN